METGAVADQLGARLDMRGNEALWVRTARELDEVIRSGRLAPGDRVPGERELAEQLGVSRVTVRRALSDLATRGVLQGEPRSGWFVSPGFRMVDPPLLRGFRELASEAGLQSASRLLSRVVRSSTVDEAEQFDIAPGTEMLELHRLHLLEGLPHAVSEATTPLGAASQLREVDFSQTGVSLLQALEDAVGGLSHARHFIEAVPADEEVAGLLGLSPGEPVLRVYERIFDHRGRLVNLTNSFARGDRVRYKTVAFRRVPPVIDLGMFASLE